MDILNYSVAALPPRPMHRIHGKVARGRQLGRTLGFPTANLPLDLSESSLKFGVYAARALLPDGRIFDGVASAGVNPSVGTVAPVLEIFIFDFCEDLYGQALTVELWAYLREEQRFPNLDELTAQIQRDVDVARQQLEQPSSPRVYERAPRG